VPNYYTDAIAKAVGCDDREALVVEEVMRVETPTLDHLDARRFNHLAREAKATLQDLRSTDPECAAWYEKAAWRS
jgi:hypothetical protein